MFLFFKVRRGDGTWHPAEVIHRRLVAESGHPFDSLANNEIAENLDGKFENGCNDEKKADKKEVEQDPYEYYVHYENFNRRLDEWVRRNRMRPLDEDVGEVITFVVLENPAPYYVTTQNEMVQLGTFYLLR